MELSSDFCEIKSENNSFEDIVFSDTLDVNITIKTSDDHNSGIIVDFSNIILEENSNNKTESDDNLFPSDRVFDPYRFRVLNSYFSVTKIKTPEVKKVGMVKHCSVAADFDGDELEFLQKYNSGILLAEKIIKKEKIIDNPQLYKDVKLITAYTNKSYDEIIVALYKNDHNIVNTIIELASS